MTLLLALLLAHAQEPWAPLVRPASDEARLACARIALPPGFSAQLFAAEPMVANPVCLAIDERGDVLVAETFRHKEGVTDVRDHMDWLDDDLASRTVADRIALLARHEGERFGAYARASDRVRWLADADGDGAADRAEVFADGFGAPESGIGAGLLARRGAVIYACIPDLWRLEDEDRDGRAERRAVLSTGYGVHIALLGHDLHGPCLGPDGRLYFSSGDRGFRVETERGAIEHPDTGAVLRCELDGSGLEVWHTGLRNPQELAFGEHGDLFTVDNNSDGGDLARLVHVVEGGDSGWRYPFQWIEDRGPWNDEKLWHPRHAGQAAYILPPLANLARGPSGLARDPGVGLPAPYAGRFFLADFVGSAADSGVLCFSLAERGASFALSGVERFLWGVLATDVAFGPDGALYVSDWVEGWEKSGKGRIHRVVHPDAIRAAADRGTAQLLARGIEEADPGTLADLLAHPDQRVRLEAELALAARGAPGRERLARAASSGGQRLARLHGIWGLGVAGRKDASALAPLVPLLADPDAEVRAQAVRVLGDERCAAAADAIVARIADDSPRVRAFAAIAASRLAAPRAFGPLVELARSTGDADPVLRHAGVLGLTRCADPARLAALASDGSPAVRLAAVLALRRRASPLVAAFLEDADAAVVAEAARAIHDAPIEAAMPELARLAGALARAPNALVRRVLCANDHLGGEERARAVASLALSAGLEPARRAEALGILAEWASPRQRDRVLGRSAPRGERAAEFLPGLAVEIGGALAADAAPAPVVEAWIELAHSARASAALELVARCLDDRALPASARVAALEAIESFRPADLARRVDRALSDADGRLRAAALGALERLAPEEALPRVPDVLAQGELSERRAAYRILARSLDARADGILAAELEKLGHDLVPAEVALDLVLAAEGRGAPEIAAGLAAHRAPRAADPVLGAWLDGLFGGDAEHGGELFRARAELACLRCHAVVASAERSDGNAERSDGERGVGPDLGGLGRRLSRLQILEAILAPNRCTTRGYEATALFLAEGGAVAGRVVGEDGSTVRVQKADGALVEVDRASIAERRADLSAMPEGLGAHLSRAEMRDLIEYLSGL